MNVALPIEEGYFNITPNKFCGLDCFLITPQADAKWNKNNLFFRSLIVDANTKKVLSSGFPKFFNYGEKLDCYPNPEKYQDWKILNKLDGSLLIADLVNGVFSMRTRGTVSYITQENYEDFQLLPKKYPKISEFLKHNQKYSLLFEIVTPNNVIVIRPKEIDFYFLGAVNKETLEIVYGEELMTIWRQIGCIPTPEQYQFNSILNLEDLSNFVQQWKGKEGVVLVYNNGQNRIKLKSTWYCFIHRVKSQLSSENNIIEYYIKNGLLEYNEFYEKIKNEFDFEIAEQLKDILQKICNAGERTKKDISNMKEFAQSIRGFETRKQQAEHINATFGSSQKSSYVFCLLDGKQLTEIQLDKLIRMHFNNNE
jgi:hypothetical protein